ncbi:hypothetical protein ACKGJO_06495 [Gracilimonas sp. Q87]|uniref:hypothetical protein n=1 Tax=Gracilimonas sp. Q87 TaxID=3384766 RepID=UPI0039845801
MITEETFEDQSTRTFEHRLSVTPIDNDHIGMFKNTTIPMIKAPNESHLQLVIHQAKKEFKHDLFECMAKGIKNEFEPLIPNQ